MMSPGGRLRLVFSLFYYVVTAFRTDYETIVVLAEDVIYLKCVSSDPQTVAYEWKHGNQRIMIHDTKGDSLRTMGGYNSHLGNDSSSACLEFQVNGTEETGDYECMTYSGSGSNKKAIWTIQLQTEDNAVTNATVIASVGKAILLNCSSDTSTAPSAVKWLKEDIVILNHETKSPEVEIGKYFTRVVSNNAWLGISAVDFDDSGVYSCFLTFPSRQRKRPTISWNLQVQGHPQISVFTNVTKENETFETTCCVKFGRLSGSSEIQWLLGDRTVDLNTSTKEFREGNSTICSNLTFVIRRTHNRQLLDCVVRNDLNASSSVMLKVLYSPSVKIDLEFYSRSVFSFSLMATLNGHLRCVSDGNPIPFVTLESKLSDGYWQEISVNSYLESDKVTTTVRSFPLQNISNGLYRCAAYNGIGPTQVSSEAKIDLELNIGTVIILALAAITILMIIAKLASCVKVSVVRNRAQKGMQSNSSDQEMNDAVSQLNDENDVQVSQSLPYVQSSSNNDYRSFSAINHVYSEKATCDPFPSDNNDEDYMNYVCDDVYANM